MELQDFYKINKHTSSLTCSKCGDNNWVKVKNDDGIDIKQCKTCSNSNLQYFFNFE